MNKFVFALLCLSSTSFAASPSEIKAAVESLPACQKYIRFDDRYVYTGFGSSSNPGYEDSILLVYDHQSRARHQLAIKDSSIDAARVDDSLFVLTPRSLEEWDLKTFRRTEIHRTYKQGFEFDYKQSATGMVAYKKYLFISHGRLGLSVFDTESRALIFHTRLAAKQAGKESMATAIVASGERAYIAMDNFTLSPPNEKSALRGIIVFNMETFKVEAELDGMDPGADALATDGQRLIVSFSGQPIWKYDLNALRSGLEKMPNPLGRIWKYPNHGHPTGSAAMDEENYYTCYYTPAHDGKAATLGPKVWKRKDLKLD